MFFFLLFLIIELFMNLIFRYDNEDFKEKFKFFLNFIFKYFEVKSRSFNVICKYLVSV